MSFPQDFGFHPFAFVGYAAGMPRLGYEYELRLINSSFGPNKKNETPCIVALIRENKRIKLLNGPQEHECCHGWIRSMDDSDVVEVLGELEQLKLNSEAGSLQDSESNHMRSAKVMATVLALETIGEAEMLELDEPIFQQTHAVNTEVGNFISAAYDTRNLITDRGLTGLLEWKVVYVM